MAMMDQCGDLSPPPEWHFDDRFLNSFLGFRYVIDGYHIPSWVERLQDTPELEGDQAELRAKGSEALDKAFDASLEDVESDALHVVSLSAGYDSRVILAELVSRVGSDNVIAVTYGSPGGYNFDLAPLIAASLDVDHQRLNTAPSDYDWTESRLTEYARSKCIPQHLFTGRLAVDEFFHSVSESRSRPCYLWDGYLGGETAGAHLDPDVETWDDAVESFLSSNYILSNLTAPDFDPRSVVPDEPLVDPSVLRYEEQLDYCIRQQYYVRGHGRSWEKTPLAEFPWLNFSLSIPYEVRIDQTLYEQILLERYPEVFKLPTPRKCGLPTDAPDWRVWPRRLRKNLLSSALQQLGVGIRHPKRMHFDYDLHLRKNREFRQFVRSLHSALEARDLVPWVPFDDLWKQHDRPLNLTNHGWELLTLASLELHIRAATPE